MNVAKLILFVLFFGMMASSCKENAEKPSTTQDEKSTDIVDELKKEGYKEAIDPEQVNPAEIINMRKFAEEALKFRQSEEGAQPWAILDVGVWEYQFKFENSKVTAEGETKGQWIDFDKDYTYKYGYYDKVEGSGKYYFNIETKQLLILDDDPMKKPYEYIAKLHNGHMVLMGTKTYKDNAYQAKLINVPHIPAKG